MAVSPLSRNGMGREFLAVGGAVFSNCLALVHIRVSPFSCGSICLLLENMACGSLIIGLSIHPR